MKTTRMSSIGIQSKYGIFAPTKTRNIVVKKIPIIDGNGKIVGYQTVVVDKKALQSSMNP